MVFETEAGRAMKLWVFPIWVLMLAQANAAVFDVIISGSGGEDEYSERFDDWGQRLRRVLIDRCDHPATNVLLVNEAGENADGTSSIGGIRNAIRSLSERVTPGDDVFIFLIGHGSYRRQVAKLNIPGADLTAEDLDRFLRSISARAHYCC